jgi:hypothetical protein
MEALDITVPWIKTWLEQNLVIEMKYGDKSIELIPKILLNGTTYRLQIRINDGTCFARDETLEVELSGDVIISNWQLLGQVLRMKCQNSTNAILEFSRWRPTVWPRYSMWKGVIQNVIHQNGEILYKKPLRGETFTWPAALEPGKEIHYNSIVFDINKILVDKQNFNVLPCYQLRNIDVVNSSTVKPNHVTPVGLYRS